MFVQALEIINDIFVSDVRYINWFTLSGLRHKHILLFEDNLFSKPMWTIKVDSHLSLTT